MAYATLADLKVFLNLPGSDRDVELQGNLDAAHGMVDRYLGRTLAVATASERVYGTDTPGCFPARTPITAVVGCVVDGRDVEVSFTDIEVRRKDGGRFGRHDEIVITYTAGLTAEQLADVKTATLITAQAVDGAADLDANMVGENIAGGVSGSFQPGGPGSIPRAAQTILGPLRRIY